MLKNNPNVSEIESTLKAPAPKRIYAAILVFLIIAGAALRLYRLDTSLWFDEIVTLITSVRSPLMEMVTHFPGNNDHPLYSVLAHISLTLFGEHPWSVRLPSALFGIAAIPVLYKLGSAVTNRFEAILAASILTVSYHHIWFSQNARGYTALVFFVLLSTHYCLRYLAEGKNRDLAGYAVATALGSYAHLTMVFVCVAHALACALHLLTDKEGKRHSFREWKRLAAMFAGAGLLTGVFYAPMLVDVHRFFTTQTATSNEVATPLWALFAAVQGLQLGFGTSWGLAIGALIFGAGIWRYFRQNRTALYLFLLPVPLTLVLAVAMARPIFPRFIFFVIGFVLLITVRGAATIGTWLAERTRGMVTPQHGGMVLASLLALGGITFSILSLPYGYRYPKQDYGQAVALVEQNKKEGDTVAVIGDTGALPILTYMGKSWQRIDMRDQLLELREKGDEVWVIYTFSSYIQASQPELMRMLEQDCTELDKFEGTVAGGSISVRRCPSTRSG